MSFMRKKIQYMTAYTPLLAACFWAAVGLTSLAPVHLFAQTHGADSTAQASQQESTRNMLRRYDYFFLQSMIQQQKGDYAAAFDLMRHAAAINPKAAEAHYHLAGYYVDLHKDSLSRCHLELASTLDKSNALYKERLAQLYITQKNYNKALSTYEELCKMQSDRSDVLHIMLQLYAMQNDYDKMIDVLNRMETLEGSSEQISLSKMQVYEQQGQPGKELAELQALVEKHPLDLNYQVMMGNWLLQNGKPKQALKAYHNVLKQEPDNLSAQLSMYDYYQSLSQNDAADKLLRHLLSSPNTGDDNKATLLRQVVSQAAKSGEDSTKVLELMNLALQGQHETCDLYMLKAAYMTLKKMPQEQINDVYRQALEVEPEDKSARFELIRYTWDKGEYDKVIDLCKPAQEYNPSEMIFYYFQGMAQYKKGEDTEALETFKKGVSQINKGSNADFVSDFYATMGDILYEKKLYKDAFAAYDSCLQWKPDNYGCMNNYAWNLCMLGRNLDKAEKMSYQTIKAEPDNCTYLDTYAWVLFNQGRYEQAKIYIEHALSRDSAENILVLEHVGDIYAMTGDTAKALDYWQKALQKNKDNAVLQKKIKLKKYIKE